MQNYFQETQARYKNFVEKTEEYIIDTDKGISNNDIEYFLGRVQSAKRIFFTGAGSSILSALFGSFYCSEKMNLPAQYVPTGHILSAKLNRDDLVILCTQGFNRGDSILVAKKTLRDNAQLIIFTGNKDSAIASEADRVFYFSPFPEKLFCRPVGVITCLEAVSKVLVPDFSTSQSLEAFRLGTARKPIFFEKGCKYVVLASGWGNPVGFNISLALREGCGIDAAFYDIETYGHGIYVSDQAWKSSGNRLKYFVVDVAGNPHSHKAVERIMPFIKATGAEYEILSSELSLPYAYFELLSNLSQSVYHSNEQNMYDMNHPEGKEENRYYHNEETYPL